MTSLCFICFLNIFSLFPSIWSTTIPFAYPSQKTHRNSSMNCKMFSFIILTRLHIQIPLFIFIWLYYITRFRIQYNTEFVYRMVYEPRYINKHINTTFLYKINLCHFKLSTVLPAICFQTVGSLGQLLRPRFLAIYLVLTLHIAVLFN